MAKHPTHKEVFEYIQSQYLACKQEWLDWCEDFENQTDTTMKNSARRFADEAYVQARLLEIMAHDLYDFDLFEWYLEQM